MTKTHRMILDELNKAYESDPTLANANKLISFVEDKLFGEMKRALDNKNGSFFAVNFIILFIFSAVSSSFFILSNGTFISDRQALLLSGVICLILTFAFRRKLENCFIKGIDKIKPKHIKNFDLYFQAKDLKNKKDFEEQEQSLVVKYLDRNGNAVEIEKFKCENPKDTIIVPFTCNANLKMLCQAVIMQRDVLPKSPFHQSIEEKIAQYEFEKSLPINVVKMISSCQTYNMQITSALYTLLKELNISEDTPDYGHIQQLLKELDKPQK